MISISEKQLVNALRVVPGIVTLLTLFLLGCVLFMENQTRQKKLKAVAKQEYFARVDLMLEQQVTTILQQLKYNRGQVEERAKEDLKSEVKQAYDLAMNLYLANKSMPEIELKQLITTAIEALRFNRGHSYVFIYNNQAKPIISSETSARITEDKKGAIKLIDQLLERHQSQNQLFTDWQETVKAQNNTTKVIFSRLFEPFGWVIGSIDNLERLETYAKKDLLEWISKVRFADDRHLFVMDENGYILSHIQQDQVGVLNHTLFEHVQQLLHSQGTGNGTFIQFENAFKPQHVNISDKYVYISSYKPWGWYIGTGVYLEEIENQIQFQNDLINYYNDDDLDYLILIFSIVTICVFLVSFAGCHLINNKFKIYRRSCKLHLSEVNEKNNELQYIADHDVLTDTVNRDCLHRIVDNALNVTRRKTDKLAVVFVNIDEYEKINNKYGYEVGDALLQSICKEIKVTLPQKATLARFDSSQFVIVVPQLTNTGYLDHIIKQILSHFTQPIQLDDLSFKVSCCFGISIYPEHAVNAKQLILNASTVVNRNKNNKNNIEPVFFYNDLFKQKIEREYLLEDKLKSAIENKEIVVVYQPQICAKTGELKGVEALCRWNNLDIGMTGPDEFIAIAEKSTLINDIGEYVFKTACQTINDAYILNNKQITLSVNISPIQLIQPNFVNKIAKITTDIGIDNRYITLEITENIFIDNLDRIKPILDSIRKLGFGLSLDDFGTGFSSLSYLSHLPITEIKIDRTFVNNLFMAEQNNNLVKTMVDIGLSNDIFVVAEGIENQQQQDLLVNLGCHLLQGYYLSKPLMLKELITKY